MLKIGIEKIFQAKYVNIDVEKSGKHLIPVIFLRNVYELEYRSKDKKFHRKFINNYEKIRYYTEFLNLGSLNKNDIIVFTAKINNFTKSKSGHKHFNFTNIHNAILKNDNKEKKEPFPQTINGLVGMIIKNRYNNDVLVKQIRTNKYKEVYKDFITTKKQMTT